MFFCQNWSKNPEYRINGYASNFIRAPELCNSHTFPLDGSIYLHYFSSTVACDHASSFFFNDIRYKILLNSWKWWTLNTSLNTQSWQTIICIIFLSTHFLWQIIQHPRTLGSCHITAWYCRHPSLFTDHLSALCRSYIVWCCLPAKPTLWSVQPPSSFLKWYWLLTSSDFWGTLLNKISESDYHIHCPSVPDRHKAEEHSHDCN